MACPKGEREGESGLRNFERPPSQNIMVFVLCYLLAINLFAFGLYGLDKRKASRGLWRISEMRLLLVAALGGSLGAWLGMKIFRHKTRKMKFFVGVPLIFALQIAAGVGIWYCMR